MSNDSVDRYSFVKQSDFQRQLFKIYDGNPPAPEEHDHILYFLDDID
ncbi:hypothetical protein [Alishewanella longhuensis]